MDKRVILLDAPGVIPKGEEDKDGLILRNAIKVHEGIEDVVGPVSDLLSKVEMTDVCKLYHIAQYKTSGDMLAQLAKKKAALRAGGEAGIEDAARTVLRDFMNGKLKYFTPAPKATIADSDSD
jgi:ribosome biogenesis GTPase A